MFVLCILIVFLDLFYCKEVCFTTHKRKVLTRSIFIDSEHLDSPYNHIYGRLPIPTRGYIPPAPRTMYIGEWD